MWTYQQSTGQITNSSGEVVATGYSGHGVGLNRPSAQQAENIGPIPQGDWTIEGPPFTHPTAGPNVLRLNPQPTTETFGRSGFLIHGDELAHPGEFLASDGCIILGPDIRLAIWASADLLLQVIA